MDCNIQLLNGEIHQLMQIARDQEIQKIKAKLKEIVQEYLPA